MKKELVTESVAANFYAVAWNKLDSGIIKELLSEDVEYVLKSKNQSLKGRKDILSYLQRNMNRIKKAPIEYEIYAEIGETIDDRPCVLLAQGNVDKIINAVFFMIEKGKITKIEVDKYDPEVVVWRSGNYPGTEDEMNDNTYVENKPKLVSDYDSEETEENKDEENIDFDVIKEKFLESNPKFRKKGEKKVWLATLLGFFFPGLGLFYISVKQGIFNLIAVISIWVIYKSIAAATIINSVKMNVATGYPNVAVRPHMPIGIIVGFFIVGFIVSVGSAIWGYLAAKYINESYI